MIEEALRARGRELSSMRMALKEGNPGHTDSIRVIKPTSAGTMCFGPPVRSEDRPISDHSWPRQRIASQRRLVTDSVLRSIECSNEGETVRCSPLNK